MPLYNEYEVSNLLDIPLSRLIIWGKNGKLKPVKYKKGLKFYSQKDLKGFPIAREVFETNWNDFIKIKPNYDYKSIELFAGGGGMALGMEKAGFHHVLLNENDKWASQTLRENRPNWNILEDSIKNVDFTKYQDRVDLVSGGFPCQAFSHAGKKRGFKDSRGELFFEFSRCIKEVRPKIFIAENVKGLLTHGGGNTLRVIKCSIKKLGYTLIEPRVLKAIYYKVPQKRERLILVGIRGDISKKINLFKFPPKYHRVLSLKEAFKKGELYNNNVPKSDGVTYSEKKKKVISQVPQGGYWRDLPDDVQREYMGKSYFLGGGKTGIARRLSFKLPSLTLVCSPDMKQTERCHPKETRALTIRESARIQTFPDCWNFKGSKRQQYKQIGNAVPVNLAYSIGISIVDFLNKIDS